MSQKTVAKVPSYRRHKSSGQAVVTIGEKDYYLGKWKTNESRTTYDRLIAEWLASGRNQPQPTAEGDLTLVELIARYWRFARSHYMKDGRPTTELACIKTALRPLKELYGRTPAAKFGPLALKAVRQWMIERDFARQSVNVHVGRIRRMFKWAASEELVPAGVFHALTTVSGLQRGRCLARETLPVGPVRANVVNAVLSHLPQVVADMVRFQRRTGCRPGEVCMLRPCDVDTHNNVWSYRPASHKTEHHGRDRVIFIGPLAQDILRPYLLRERSAFCFSPQDSERKRNDLRRENRKSPMTPSQSRRHPKRNHRRPPRSCYTTNSYRRAIHRACDLACVDRWSPNQLRHAAVTEIRARYGLEAAATVLGHKKADVTQIYAERDLGVAARVMKEVG